MHHEMDHTPRPSTSHMQHWDLVFVPIDLPLKDNIPSLLLFALLDYKPQIHESKNTPHLRDGKNWGPWTKGE